MEAISHLDCIGRSLLATFGVRAGAIADAELDATMTTQPVGEHLSIALIEQIDGLVGFEVDQQCSVPVLFAQQRDVIDA